MSMQQVIPWLTLLYRSTLQLCSRHPMVVFATNVQPAHAWAQRSCCGGADVVPLACVVRLLPLVPTRSEFHDPAPLLFGISMTSSKAKENNILESH